jgi:7-carboxy-7-deazaguanine synthase
MKLVEHFVSINGEGRYQGYPTLFLRFSTCNLRCSYCDSPYSYEGGEEKTVQEIVDIVIKSGLKRVTITGGEPLAQGYDMYLLCNQLLRYGYNVEVETNGSYDISDLPYNSRLCITMDWKCPSSGMMEHMLTENLDKLESKDVLKFVCGSEDDLLTARHIINHYGPKCQVFFSPVFGQIEPKRIVEFMIENKLYNCRVQLQSHKIIWPPEQRGV